MTFIDIVIGMILIGFMISGFKNGFVKKIVGIICLVVALIAGAKFSTDVNELVFAEIGITGSTGFVLSFILIVLAITFAQSLIYKIMFKEMFDAMWNKILGIFMGLFEGTIAISITLIVLSIFLGLPSTETRTSSDLYKPIKNFAPMVFDQVNTFLPESKDFYYEILNFASDEKKKMEKK
ncbi:MAG: CvpA family protein [Bacteroidota bacterium]